VLSTGKRKTIPLVVTISDLNDNAPAFVNTPYQVTIPEVVNYK
jgi:protocadherin-15